MANPLINITRRQALQFACFLVLYEFLTYIANDMIMPAMVSVVRDFHARESDIATSLTAYILGGASLQLILGPLSDRYGRRPVMLLGAFLFFIFTLAIANTFSINQFLIARYFQGMGLCFISVIGYATIQEIFAEMDAIRLTAFMANIAIIAPLLGPLAGAVFVHYFSWHYLFIMIAGFALVTYWGLFKFMPETLGQTTHEGHHYAVMPFNIKTMLANYTALLKNARFLLYTLAIGLVSAPGIIWIALAPVMLITKEGLTVVDYALWQIPLFGACILGNIILRHLTHHFEIKGLIKIGTIVSLTGILISFFMTLSMHGSTFSMIPGLVIYFAGWSLALAPLSRIVLFATDITKGTASALCSMIAMIVQSLLIEVASIAYQGHNNIYYGFVNVVIILGLVLVTVIALKLEALLPNPSPTGGRREL